MANPGQMDRRIKLQARTLTEDETMSKVETWADDADVWAGLVKNTGNRGEIANSDRTQLMKTFRCRWRSDVSPTTHRVIYKGNTYKITGIEEVGRQDRMDLICEAKEGIS